MHDDKVSGLLSLCTSYGAVEDTSRMDYRGGEEEEMMGRPEFYEVYLNGRSIVKETTAKKAWDAARKIIFEDYKGQWITIHLGGSGSEVRQSDKG